AVTCALLFRGRRLRSGGADCDAWIVDYEPRLVVYELGLELERRRRVLVPLTIPVVRPASVGLVESLDAEVQRTDVCRRRVGFLADLEAEPVDGKRVGQRRRFEIDVLETLEARR